MTSGTDFDQIDDATTSPQRLRCGDPRAMSVDIPRLRKYNPLYMSRAEPVLTTGGVAV